MIFQELTDLANSFTYHGTATAAPELLTKQENLRTFARGKKAILEIGFNAGHSAALFCEANPTLELVCVDIGIHKYVRPCYELLRSRYGDRIQLIVSSSLELTRLPELQSKLKHFDGVHVDGHHEHPWYIYDTMSCLRFLSDKAQFIMDDSNHPPIARWVQFLKSSLLFETADEYLPTHLYEHTILNFTRPRVGICSFAVGEQYRSHVQKCIISLEKYCSKWNIPLLTCEESLDLTRPIPWSKIKLLQKHLDSFDVLYWIDADILITKPEHSLDERLIFLTRNHDLLISHDFNTLNSGSFAVRNTPWVKTFLEEIYSRTEFIHHFWWENMALITILFGDADKMKRARVIPKHLSRLINIYPSIHDPVNYHKFSDWLIHFASYRGNQLMNLIEKTPIDNDSGLNKDNLNNLVEIVELFW
jgi:hypothetical protein